MRLLGKLSLFSLTKGLPQSSFQSQGSLLLPSMASGSNHQKRHSRDKRFQKRTDQQAKEGTTIKGIAKKHRQESSLLSSSILVDSLPVTSSGWQGKPMKADETPYTKDYLVKNEGFEGFSWDGM